MKIVIIIISLCFSPLLVASVLADQKQVIKELEDYRTANYKAPVPMTVAGAGVIDTALQLQDFMANNDGSILLDVYPAPRKPDNLPKTGLWLEPKRQTLPDAIWLANTGMGVLTVKLDKLFQQQLAQLTGGDKDHIVIIFCEPECWHSWNAAKRAVSYGYGNVHWYRQGVAGWQKEGLPVRTKEPVRP